jgi:hypothetical protein
MGTIDCIVASIVIAAAVAFFGLMLQAMVTGWLYDYAPDDGGLRGNED